MFAQALIERNALRLLAGAHVRNISVGTVGWGEALIELFLGCRRLVNMKPKVYEERTSVSRSRVIPCLVTRLTGLYIGRVEFLTITE